MSRTVLIVDDHPSFRASARAMLESEGFDVVGEAADGASALDAVRGARTRRRAARRPAARHDRLRRLRGARAAQRRDRPTSSSCRAATSSDYGELVSASCACGFVPKGELSGDARRRTALLSRLTLALGVALARPRGGASRSRWSRRATTRPSSAVAIRAGRRSPASAFMVCAASIALVAPSGQPDGHLPRGGRATCWFFGALHGVEQRLDLHHRLRPRRTRIWIPFTALLVLATQRVTSRRGSSGAFRGSSVRRHRRARRSASLLLDPTPDPECAAARRARRCSRTRRGGRRLSRSITTQPGSVLALIAVVDARPPLATGEPGRCGDCAWPCSSRAGAAALGDRARRRSAEPVSSRSTPDDAFQPVFFACFRGRSARVPASASCAPASRARPCRSSSSRSRRESRSATRSQARSATPSSTSSTGSTRSAGSEAPAGSTCRAERAGADPTERERSVKLVEHDGVRVAAIVYDRVARRRAGAPRGGHRSRGAGAPERPAAGRAARRGRASSTTVTNTAPSLLVNIGTDGRIRSINVAALEAAGYDGRRARSRRATSGTLFIDPSERDDDDRALPRARSRLPAGRVRERVHERARRACSRSTGAPRRCRTSRARSSSIVSGGLDITERRKRELELERERDATTTALETIPSIVVVLDRDGTIRDRDVDNPRVGANRAFRQALGWRDDELVGRPFLDLVAEDDDGRAAAAIATAAAGGASEEVESELRCADGSVARVRLDGRSGRRRDGPHGGARARLGHRRHRAPPARGREGARARLPERDREQRAEPPVPHRRRGPPHAQGREHRLRAHARSTSPTRSAARCFWEHVRRPGRGGRGAQR